MASPIAKKRCCRSSSRRNSTGNNVGGGPWRVRCGLELRQARGVVRVQLLDAEGGADERQPVRRQHQRIRRQGRESGERARNRASGSPSGSTGQTLTLVLILGSSMSPEIQTPRSSQYSAMCSGECP